jgi:predicted aconitase with swiveling domain
MLAVKGRTISRGACEGEVIISKTPISFLGGVDPKTGIVLDKESTAFGKSISGKVFLFPSGKGSTVGSYVILQLKKNGVAPIALINSKAETIIAVGAIISRIPMIDLPEEDIFKILNDGDIVKVDANIGIITKK